MDNNTRGGRQVSAMGQFLILTERQMFILKANLKKLLMIVLLPVVTAIIVGAVSGSDVFVTYENTKSCLFAIVCVSIWIGLFNSIQEICQERGVLKREYMANLRLISYISSKFFVQAILCLIQTGVFLGVCSMFVNFSRPGLITPSYFSDMYITVFLIMLASDALGLFVSSVVKSGDIANITAPIILIVQLVLSGVLFDLEGFGEFCSYLTFGKWGMDGLGALSDMNHIDLYLVKYAPDEPTRQTLMAVMPHNPYDGFSYTPGSLLKTWLILIGFCVLLVFMSSLVLRLVAKDSR